GRFAAGSDDTVNRPSPIHRVRFHFCEVIDYWQLVEIILTELTSRRGPDIESRLCSVVVEVVDDVVLADELPFHSVWPVTSTLWPTCLSRSCPPSSFHDMLLPAVVADASVVDAVVDPVVPAVVVSGFELVRERLLIASFIRALFNV